MPKSQDLVFLKNKTVESSPALKAFTKEIIEKSKAENSKRPEKQVTLSCKVPESDAIRFTEICKETLHLSSPNKLFKTIVYAVINEFKNQSTNKRK